MRFKVGDMIASDVGQIAEVIEEVDRDRLWKCAGYRIVPQNTGTGDGYGHSHFLSESIAAGWRPAAHDWTVVPRSGGRLEERWTFVMLGRYWVRDLRRIDELS